LWLKTTKIHRSNPDKNKSGPPPVSGTMVFVVQLNTTIYSHKRFRYNIYMEIKTGWMHEVSFRGICTWCMYEVEILELLT